MRDFPLLSRLLAGLLAVATNNALAQDTLRERVNRALDDARPALLAHLRAASNSVVRPGELALVVLAGVHDGLDLQNEVFAKAVQRLARANPEETYDLALRLMVCEAFAAFPDREALAKNDAKELLAHRMRTGGFGYTSKAGSWDLSNTQYAALGLRCARALGVKIERTVWQKLADEICAQQDSYGGFDYGHGDRANNGAQPYASMTAAGIAVLAICRQELDDGGKAPKALDGRIDRGWQWFARHVDAIGAPKEHWSFYFHYGLERACILCDVEKVGATDWYERGANMFVAEQLSGGGWHNPADAYPGVALQNGRGELVATSFAVLFLRRKFQKQLGPVTPRTVMLANLGADAKTTDVDACAAELVRRGKTAMPDVLDALRSEVEPRRRAAAAAMQAIAGDAFGYDAAKDLDANRDAMQRAALWWLKNRG
jgi:hypothetical protein